MRDTLWLVLAAVFLFGGYWIQKNVFSGSDNNRNTVVTDCNITRSNCRLKLAGGYLDFSVEPKQIVVLQPFTLSLVAEGVAPDKVQVEFEGINMDMGYNRVFLEADTDDPRIFSAKALLPACTRDKMFWHIHVIVDESGSQTDFLFTLETRRP